MARRLLSTYVRMQGGPTKGGPSSPVYFYTDEALTSLATIYQRSSGAGTQPNPLLPNAGVQVTPLADRLATDTYITVTSVASFQVGDLIPIYDAVNVVYRVVTAITAGTRRLDLDSALGFAFAAATTKVNNVDMRGHIWGYFDDALDYYYQPRDLASGRRLPPLVLPVRVPSAALGVQEEGALVGTRAALNFIGAGVTATDDAANGRVNVTLSSPSAAAFADHSAQHEPGGSDALAIANVQVFTASGTWTKPAGAKAVEVIAFGGGGGGAGPMASGATGGGGGGGARARGLFLPASLGATETITVGAGGTGTATADAAGGVGGTSSFGAHLSAYGGAGGQSSNNGGGGGGTAGAGSGVNGGAPAGAATGTMNGIGGGGASAPNGGTGATAYPAEYGGAAGGGGTASRVGGGSIYGGGGGGGSNAAGGVSGSYTAGGGAAAANPGTAGTSRSGSGRAGNGGAGGSVGGGLGGGAGGAPAGGGGAAYGPAGGASGAGGRGEVIVVTYF